MSLEPEDPPDLERAYQELLSLLFRGKIEVTAAKSFRPVAEFVSDLPPW
ncbi:hypothetical protein ACRU44_04535 [Mycobacterium colombiense]